MDDFDRATYLSKLTALIDAANEAAAETSAAAAPSGTSARTRQAAREPEKAEIALVVAATEGVKRRLQTASSIKATAEIPLQDASAAMAALGDLVCVGATACAETSATLDVAVGEANEPVFTPSSGNSNTGDLKTIDGADDKDIAIAVALSVSRR